MRASARGLSRVVFYTQLPCLALAKDTKPSKTRHAPVDLVWVCVVALCKLFCNHVTDCGGVCQDVCMCVCVCVQVEQMRLARRAQLHYMLPIV